MCRFFSDSKDIKLAVHESIPYLEQHHTLVGWIRAASVPDATGLINEISRLTQENGKLSEEIKRKAANANTMSAEEVEETKFRTLAIALAHEPYELPQEGQLPSSAIDVEESLMWGDPFIRRAFSGGCEMPAINELLVFYFLGPPLLTGIDRMGGFYTGFVLIKPCAVNWTLEELIEPHGSDSSEGYVLSPKGRRFLRMLKSTKREIAF